MTGGNRRAHGLAVIVFILSSAALSARTIGAATPPRCLTYDARVEVTGTLERHTYPGPPNYESIKDGDAPETGFYVHTSEPLCADPPANAGQVGSDEPARHVRMVQLVLDQPGYDRLRPRLGARVTVSGVLFGASTGHHHAPLLIEKVELVPPPTK